MIEINLVVPALDLHGEQMFAIGKYRSNGTIVPDDLRGPALTLNYFAIEALAFGADKLEADARFAAYDLGVKLRKAKGKVELDTDETRTLRDAIMRFPDVASTGAIKALIDQADTPKEIKKPKDDK